MLLGLLYAHGVIYLKEHTLFWVVAQLWTCDLCKCFQNLGYYYYFFGCLFLNDISEWELADLLFATGPRRDCHCCKAQIALFIVEKGAQPTCCCTADTNGPMQAWSSCEDKQRVAELGET